MKSKIFLFVCMLLLIAPSIQTNAREQKNDPTSDLPEQAGVYDVPEHPGLKLRVFVYHAKTDSRGKPGPAAPKRICGPTITLDPDSRSVVLPAGWKLPANWEYNLNPSSLPGNIGTKDLVTIAANSIKTWQLQTNGTITVNRGSDTLTTKASRDFKNIIAWGRTSGTALAVSYIWYQNGVAQEIDTIFNKNFSWYWSDPSQWPNGQTCAYSGVYDAQNILTHELGHTFGLDDMKTSNYADNTMYGYGSKEETKKNTLTSGDIAGMETIY